MFWGSTPSQHFKDINTCSESSGIAFFAYNDERFTKKVHSVNTAGALSSQKVLVNWRHSMEQMTGGRLGPDAPCLQLGQSSDQGNR